MTKLISQNTDWGFFGTLQSNYSIDYDMTCDLYNYAANELSFKYKVDIEKVVLWLDSRAGRHFADHMSFFGALDISTGIDRIGFCKVIDKTIKANHKTFKKEL